MGKEIREEDRRSLLLSLESCQRDITFLFANTKTDIIFDRLKSAFDHTIMMKDRIKRLRTEIYGLT